MVVHPGHGNYSGTLLNGLIHHSNNYPQIQIIGRAWFIELIKIPVDCW